jgi:hypothetical protein
MLVGSQSLRGIFACRSLPPGEAQRIQLTVGDGPVTVESMGKAYPMLCCRNRRSAAPLASQPSFDFVMRAVDVSH